MRSLSTLKRYLGSIDLQRFLEELGASNVEALMDEVKHFTEKEAEKRDQIVLDYFGEHGVKRITRSIVNRLLSQPKLRDDAKILDVGAGSGFFTLRVASELHRYKPEVAFYAMDITPAMLLVLARKRAHIIPFLGIAENITGSVEHARKYLTIPKKFDAIFSTLALHHCLDVESVFKSIRNSLEEHGKVIVIDLCKHPFEEFRKEMGDIHLGFNPSWIEEVAEKFFPHVHVEKMRGICCESSGRSAELFIASMAI